MRDYPVLYLTAGGCVFGVVVGVAAATMDMAWSAYLMGIMAGALGAHVNRDMKDSQQ